MWYGEEEIKLKRIVIGVIIAVCACVIVIIGNTGSFKRVAVGIYSNLMSGSERTAILYSNDGKVSNKVGGQDTISIAQIEASAAMLGGIGVEGLDQYKSFVESNSIEYGSRQILDCSRMNDDAEKLRCSELFDHVYFFTGKGKQYMVVHPYKSSKQVRKNMKIEEYEADEVHIYSMDQSFYYPEKTSMIALVYYTT